MLRVELHTNLLCDDFDYFDDPKNPELKLCLFLSGTGEIE